MNSRQLVAAVVGLVAMGILYYLKFVAPISTLKRQHPEIFAAHPPNAVVGGLSGTLMLLFLLVVTVAAIILLRSKT